MQYSKRSGKSLFSRLIRQTVAKPMLFVLVLTIAAGIQFGAAEESSPHESETPTPANLTPTLVPSGKTAQIAGGVFALLVFLALLAGGGYWYYRNRHSVGGDDVRAPLAS
jgi:hypothetical protein